MLLVRQGSSLPAKEACWGSTFVDMLLNFNTKYPLPASLIPELPGEDAASMASIPTRFTRGLKLAQLQHCMKILWKVFEKEIPQERTWTHM